MVLKIILAFIALAIGAFVAYRFGLFSSFTIESPLITDFTTIPQRLLTEVRPSDVASPSGKVSTTSAKILLLSSPSQASASQKFKISWFVDNDKAATINHTALHYGKIAKPNPKLPTDYPEKSAILKGTIPATFSAELSIGVHSLYYYRAHAIIDGAHVWSDEKTIDIFRLVQSAATTSASTQ